MEMCLPDGTTEDGDVDVDGDVKGFVQPDQIKQQTRIYNNEASYMYTRTLTSRSDTFLLSFLPQCLLLSITPRSNQILPISPSFFPLLFFSPFVEPDTTRQNLLTLFRELRLALAEPSTAQPAC